MKEKIYNQLRAAKRQKSYNLKSTENTLRDDRKSQTVGEVREEVNDFTLAEIENFLLEEGLAKKFYGLVGQGKEANVYWLKDHRNKLVAMKMFRIHTTSHNYNAMHSRSKLSDSAKLRISENLCTREYENLVWAFDRGIKVPKPIQRHEFMYFMEFLGDKRGASPLLRDVNVEDYGFEPIDILDEILEQLDLLFNTAEMVHGDFSEHNLVWHKNLIYVIDFLQVDRYHPRYQTPEKIRKREALIILRRDITSILDHFAKKYRSSYGVDEVMSAINEIDLTDLAPDQHMSEFFDEDAFQEELKRKFS